MELLHLKYLQREPGGYRYSWSCHEYALWLKRRGATMRQVHRVGEKLFVDYTGKRPCIWDGTTGEKVDVELLIAVLSASNLTYTEATTTQRGPQQLPNTNPQRRFAPIMMPWTVRSRGWIRTDPSSCRSL